ncbi:MAG: winged helix-turn-helix domain-containing protein [Candidatus Thermoplasmatota archaeon]|nr:winged helix-turn-helix transcriptional regulator [Euryarchaeota archaeon]MBU4031852.1 winged helix-turn-helix domain-containing protein [Candidatus Thermoplasmatota archaeon]MBU4072374.1 winged helix-turn-helix domain-containing protein [Candidatus Thermoplasmatota archaeon]MBU4143832.1 winged helix-turn-helix domain-containing protein [Candidatus Thermoplasmatota archaeon]MBU4591898.1 winged helix-turn-helix domain-containing protein [Candidatus Thermoplasmatota archaeon]
MIQECKEMTAVNMAQVLGDENSRKILIATHLKPKTASEISENYGIPIAICYRRIKTLENMALVQKDEQILTQKGKRRWSYISNIHKLELMYRDGKIAARYELRNGFVENL